MAKVTINVAWVKGKKGLLSNPTWQKKTFTSEMDAVQWCRSNAEHIERINNSRPFLDDQITHWDILDAIHGRVR